MTKTKTMSVIESSLRIAIEIISLLLLFAGTAGATTQIINVMDPVGDVNLSYIDIVQVIINKDSDIYTSQIIVAGNIETTNAQYTITINDGVKDSYLIMVSYNVNGSGIYENTSTLLENTTSVWIYNETRGIQSSVNGNTLTMIADFSGIDLTGSTFRKAGAYWFAPDKNTLIAKDTVKFTITDTTPTPTVTATPTPTVTATVTATPTPTVTATPTATATPVFGTKGDLSGDGQVSVVDALFIAQYTVGTRTLTSTQLAAADVSGDGQVTIVDALFIAQYTVGLRQL